MNNTNDRNIIISQNASETDFARKQNLWKYCYIYAAVILSLSVLFLINYIFTHDALNKYRIIYIDPKQICKDQISQYQNCKNINSSDYLGDICLNFSKSAKRCFDDLVKFNKRCHIYISDYSQCISTKASCSILSLKNCNNFSQEIKIDYIIKYLSNN